MVDLQGLTPDCARCAGLCCTALPYAASADFPETKPANVPCRHLQADFACEIHADLRAHGWRGCTVFECFGAGQQVTQHTFGGANWREEPAIAAVMFAAFEAMRVVQEIRYYLRVLGDEHLPEPLAARVAALDADAATLADGPAAGLDQDAVRRLHEQAGPLLREASENLRAQSRAVAPVGTTRSADRRGRARAPRLAAYADLAGADLRGERLDGTDLRGAVLIGADLTAARLTRVDLLGADLRDARLDGADLRTALFLTQTQVNAAAGTDRTRLPDHLRRPAHWRSSGVGN